MLGKWKVREKELARVIFFQVYRDTDGVKQTVETIGGLWSTKEEAEALAQKLNEEGKR